MKCRNKKTIEIDALILQPDKITYHQVAQLMMMLLDELETVNYDLFLN